jgi:alkylhydroperoxidase/carboxymuconolactone decarboxylase family protein YurZ
MAIGEAPVLEALTDINAVSVARTELDPASLLLVRLAALAAVDAPRGSYLMHIGPALDAGVTIDQVRDVLVAVAPITGTPRVLSASVKITEALGIAVAITEAAISEDATGRQEQG